jgi:dienelactone hydrolase
MRNVGFALTAVVFLAPVARSAPDAGAPQREQEVTLPSGSITLAGTLVLPAGPGPHPAIVLVHGSGDGPRQPLLNFARRFAEDGLVALVYDKRGSGRSQGSWVRSSLDDLASDALAGVRLLRSRPDVDAKRIGVWGISQGGWVVPRAAAREPDAFAFMVLVTGGAVHPRDVERTDAAAKLDAAQVNPEQKQKGLALYDRYLAYLGNGKDRAGLEAALKASADQPEGRALQLERIMPAPDGWSAWSWVANYDPLEDIRKLRVPILVVLGGQDRPSLASETRNRWFDGLGANRDATVLTLLGAGHGATVAGTHHHGGGQAYVPGYPDLVDTWLRSHLAARSP